MDLKCYSYHAYQQNILFLRYRYLSYLNHDNNVALATKYASDSCSFDVKFALVTFFLLRILMTVL